MGEACSAASPRCFASSPAVALTRAKPDVGRNPCRFSGGGQGGRQLGLEERRKPSTDPHSGEREVSVRADFWCRLELTQSPIHLGCCQGSGKRMIKKISKARVVTKAALSPWSMSRRAPAWEPVIACWRGFVRCLRGQESTTLGTARHGSSCHQSVLSS